MVGDKPVTVLNLLCGSCPNKHPLRCVPPTRLENVLYQGEVRMTLEPSFRLSSRRCGCYQPLNQLSSRLTLDLCRDAKSTGIGTRAGVPMRSAGLGMFVECAKALAQQLIAARE